MIYLQIWIGDKPSTEMLNWMKSVLKKQVGKNDKYILISNYNFLSRYKKVSWIDVDEYIIPFINNDDRIKKIWYKMIPIQKSNLIRLLYASENKNVFYIDTDVEIFKKIKIDKNKVCFGEYIFGGIDTYMFYNADNLNLFKKISHKCLGRICRKNKINLNEINQHDFIINKILFLSLNPEINIVKIDNNIFNHFLCSLSKIIIKRMKYGV